MQSADRFGPLKGLCPYKALIGLTQATGLAGGFDCLNKDNHWLCQWKKRAYSEGKSRQIKNSPIELS